MNILRHNIRKFRRKIESKRMQKKKKEDENQALDEWKRRENNWDSIVYLGDKDWPKHMDKFR